MKINRFFFFFLIISFFVDAQKLSVESDNWEFVKRKAEKEQKNIIVDIYTEWCTPCKQMDLLTFSNALILDKIEKNFIYFKYNPEKDKTIEVFSKYINEYPTILFFNSKGRIVNRVIGFRSPELFQKDIAKAVDEGQNPDDSNLLYTLEEKYIEGNRDNDFLKKYILKRRQFDFDNCKILNEYLGQLPLESSTSFETMYLIAICFTGSNETTTINNPLFSIFINNKQILFSNNDMKELAQRAIYRRVEKSIDEAILKNDLQLFEKSSKLINSVNPYPNATEDIKRDIFIKSINFYKKNNIVSNLISVTNKYLEDSLVKLNIEKIKTITIEEFDKYGFRNSLNSSGLDTTELHFHQKNLIKIRINDVAYYLNEGAWVIYEKVVNKFELIKAQNWSKRAIELDYRASYIDTFAHLLYKNGNKSDAILWEKKAVEKAKNEKKDFKNFENELLKMERDLF
jgi:thiol-disulfide isomerase/thioredoxin